MFYIIITNPKTFNNNNTSNKNTASGPKSNKSDENPKKEPISYAIYVGHLVVLLVNVCEFASKL